MLCCSGSMKSKSSKGVDSKGTHQAVTSFVLRVVAAVMGCFFGCLRVKDSSASSSRTSSSAPASSEVVIRKRNRLSSLMLTESMKEEESSKLEEEENVNRESVLNMQVNVDMKELKEEAKFLKAWGTLPETPTEIRKMSSEGKFQLSGNRDPEDSKSRSWPVGMPIEQDPCQPPTPVQKFEELVEGTVSLSTQNSGPISSRSDEDNIAEQTAMTSKGNADQGYKSASVAQGKKSVRFYCDAGKSSVQQLSPEINETSKDLGVSNIGSILRPDPYPTPVRLHDELQTPGTVFSAYQDGMADGKKPRIRSQYVKAVLNPVENLYQWQGTEDEVSELSKVSVELEESLEEAEVMQSLSGKELNMESNLASWLKSNVTNQDEDKHSMSQDNVLRIRNLDDRPILGLVAAHWNENEASQVSPISWDGNGIPNSTSKYKEDQKVSWHSTPFVERLEKALSEDTMLPQRKLDSGSSETEISGREESDTALSKLQSSVNIKSIASY